MTSESSALQHPPQAGRLSRLVGSPWFWVGFVAVAFSYHLGRAIFFGKQPADPPKVFYQVPEFTLTDQMGKPFGTKDLAGKIWIANFVFTHCPTLCEGLTTEMSKLQKRLRYMRDSTNLVSFSVDPENDTPEKLYDYASKHKANHLRWRFLTGDVAAVKKAVVEGFKLPMEKETDMPVDDQLMNIAHGTRFVLVDPQLRIRGYYEIDEAGIAKLLEDVAFLSEQMQ
jgi:protein SCO1/2